MSQESNQTLHLSSRRRRVAAFLIDHFVVTFLMVSIIFIALGPNYMDESNSGKMTLTMLAVMMPGFLLYFAKDSIQGVSVGKWIMGIMVRNQEDTQAIPSFVRLLVRNFFIIIWPVEFIVLAISEEKKRLGDKVVRTIVVNNPQKSTKLPRILTLVGVGIAFFVFTFLFAGAAMKNSDAYKIAIQEIEKDKDVLAVTGGINGYGWMPTGNVSISNGNGQAQFEIKVLGNDKDLSVSVFLTKEPNGEWKVVELSK